jgi:hypothetical protein
MIFEIKYSTRYEDDGIVHQMDTLEELLTFVRIKAPLIDTFSPGVSLRPTENPNVWEVIVYDNFQKELENKVEAERELKAKTDGEVESNIIKLS